MTAPTIVQRVRSRDTAKCIAALAEGVESKSVVGLAFVVFYGEREYDVHLCGAAHASHTFTSGTVNQLRHKVDRLVRSNNQGKK